MRASRCVVIGLVMGILACGGGKKEVVDPDDGGGGGDDDGGGGGASMGSTDMVPPEKMDEIQVRLDRKRGMVARCLSDAVLAGTAPRTTKGKITVEFVISPSGQAEQITVAKASLKVAEVQDCVIGKVKEIAFPELPRALEWSYTFALDSN